MKRIYLIAAAVFMTLFSATSPSFAGGTYGAGWEISIAVTYGDDINTVAIGGDKTATNEFENRWETRAMLGGSLKAYIYHPEWGLDTPYFWSDIRDVSLPQTWPFYISTSYSTVTLTWNPSLIQPAMNASFTDSVTGTVVDMKAQSSYVYSSSSSTPRAFTITADGYVTDGNPPETSIVSVQYTPDVLITYAGTDDISGDALLKFSTNLDGGPWSAYSSDTSAVFSGLSDGGHVFSVVAMDAAGNVDSTPATTIFAVDGVPPSFAITPRRIDSKGIVQLGNATPPGVVSVELVLDGTVKDASDIASFTYDAADSYGIFSAAGPVSVSSLDNTFAVTLNLPGLYDGTLGTRVYTIILTAKDRSGNAASKTVRGYIGKRKDLHIP